MNGGTSVAGRLNARVAATVTKPGRHGDGNGLYLLVKPSGAKSWVLRTVVRGRRCDIGLGGYPLVSLAEARAAAFDNRKLARTGGDPLALKRRPDIPVFEEAARTVIEIHKPTWRDGGKSAGQWESSLRQNAFPRLGAKRVDTITTADVMAVLLPIWTAKAETARRVRQRIGTIMKWAVAQGYRDDNPAGDAIGAGVAESERRAPAFPGRASQRGRRRDPGGAGGAGVAGVARLTAGLRVSGADAARSGEVRGAAWSEIDMDAATWTIPGERMKGGREHRVRCPAARWRFSMRRGRSTTGVGWCFRRRPGASRCPIRRYPSCCANSVSTPSRTASARPSGTGVRRPHRRPARSPKLALPTSCGVSKAPMPVRTCWTAAAGSMDRWAAYLASDAGDKVVPMARPSGEAGQ